MKKIIIFLLCFLMIFPNSLITYAAESSENIMNQQESPDVPVEK